MEIKEIEKLLFEKAMSIKVQDFSLIWKEIESRIFKEKEVAKKKNRPSKKP